jgi:hypothetical protein
VGLGFKAILGFGRAGRGNCLIPQMFTNPQALWKALEDIKQALLCPRSLYREERNTSDRQIIKCNQYHDQAIENNCAQNGRQKALRSFSNSRGAT